MSENQRGGFFFTHTVCLFHNTLSPSYLLHCLERVNYTQPGNKNINLKKTKTQKRIGSNVAFHCLFFSSFYLIFFMVIWPWPFFVLVSCAVD